MGGGQGGCERRIEVIVRIQKNWGGGVGDRGRRGGSGRVGGGGCERRIKVFVKIQKKNLGGGGGGIGGGGGVGSGGGLVGMGGSGWM